MCEGRWGRGEGRGWVESGGGWERRRMGGGEEGERREENEREGREVGVGEVAH